MHKFCEIQAFYQVARYVAKTNEDPEVPAQYKVTSPVTYRGTVKLHGSNSGVICTDDSLQAQSRNRTLEVDSDNMGFAAFVRDQTDAIMEIQRGLRNQHGIGASKKIVLYGEWIGPGIQNGMATCKLPAKQWVLFAVKVVDGDNKDYADILPKLGDTYAEAGIYTIHDVPTYEITVDFSKQESKEAALKKAEALTDAVEEACPWGKRFGIDGMGEGIVWVPTGEHWGNDDLYWKSKGDKHKQVKRAKRNKPMLDPEVVESVAEFVEFAVTENRLRQGLDYLREMEHPIEHRSIPAYLKWVGQDVKKECGLELQDNDLDWKQVSKAVNRKALDFFKGYIERAAMAGDEPQPHSQP